MGFLRQIHMNRINDCDFNSYEMSFCFSIKILQFFRKEKLIKFCNSNETIFRLNLQLFSIAICIDSLFKLPGVICFYDFVIHNFKGKQLALGMILSVYGSRYDEDFLIVQVMPINAAKGLK